MPSIGRRQKEKAARDWLGAKAWVVGQAVALRHQAGLLSSSRKSQAVLGLDLIYFDCYACHHEVMDRVQGVSEGGEEVPTMAADGLYAEKAWTTGLKRRQLHGVPSCGEGKLLQTRLAPWIKWHPTSMILSQENPRWRSLSRC